MSRVASRALAAMPLVAVATSFAALTKTPAVLGVALLGVLLSVVVAPYLDASPFTKRVTLATIVLASAFGAGTLARRDPASAVHIWSIVAATAIFAALVRRFFREPEAGQGPDFVLLALALVACGERRAGWPYAVGVVAFVVTSLVSLRARDLGSPPRVVELRLPRTLTLMLAGAGLIAITLASFLPWLGARMQAEFERYVLPEAPSRTGFADRIDTGAPPPSLQSDAVVLRVSGPHVDYLRGRVYDTFDYGAWSASVSPTPVETSKFANAAVEVRMASSDADVRSHYFLPARAAHVETERGAALLDAFAVLRPRADEDEESVRFDLGVPDHAPSPPGKSDLGVPPPLRQVLERIARGWTLGQTTPAGVLVALERHLSRDFTYSLLPDDEAGSELTPYLPPIVRFLTVTRRGHCELFATALALLARASGVPARVVGGFRVVEHNPLGGYDVVRERDAHAWVEAWIPGEGWRTMDPTPPSEDAGLARRPGRLAILGDVIAAAWDRAGERIGRAQAWEFAVLLGGAIAALVLIRVVRSRRTRRARPDDRALVVPLPSFVRLEAALAGRGLSRPHSESLERFASRLEGAGEDAAASVVRDYGALRYGGIGDERAVALRLEACARTLGTARAPEVLRDVRS